MMQAGWQKGMSRDEVALISEVIKAVAIATMEINLYEHIVSQSVNWSVGRLVGRLVS